MFLYKSQFLLIFSFLSIPIELWESTAAFFPSLFAAERVKGQGKNLYTSFLNKSVNLIIKPE